ncbi:M15 family metallopeptidase [Actinoplanes sp. GCM10030250]|uniref:M15 family metallopeptidase n=1 Tax=Actinoplanes sp. GCM10030250 TaxID=3273376 RepID=UPI003622B2AC
MSRAAVHIAAPALLIVSATASPAQAAAAKPAEAPAAKPAQAAAAKPAEAPAATAAAGTTWVRVMRLKLDLETEATRLATQLPALRTTVIVRNTEIIKAQRVQASAAKTVTIATAADQTARTRHAAAKTAAIAAKKALTATKKRHPRSKTRIAKATQKLIAANVTVKTRAATVRQTATTLKTTRSTYASATSQVTAATTAHQAAITTVTIAQTKIAVMPQKRASLAVQATTLSGPVVTQTRAGFTIKQTTKVYGVTVNKIVAFPFQRMLDDAAKAGVPLSGGGFRTKEQQIALRKSNGCPDVWTAPSSSCRVPTAIPGRSLHELGLAIDITSGGKTVNSRKSPAFKWLAANAGKYGLVNLPSEPWHWSITGH